jgi:hypothetical protein
VTKATTATTAICMTAAAAVAAVAAAATAAATTATTTATTAATAATTTEGFVAAHSLNGTLWSGWGRGEFKKLRTWCWGSAEDAIASYRQLAAVERRKLVGLQYTVLTSMLSVVIDDVCVEVERCPCERYTLLLTVFFLVFLLIPF